LRAAADDVVAGGLGQRRFMVHGTDEGGHDAAARRCERSPPPSEGNRPHRVPADTAA
jgi:hypothetical protein